jgi:hypothetical protein
MVTIVRVPARFSLRTAKLLSIVAPVETLFSLTPFQPLASQLAVGPTQSDKEPGHG